VTIEIVTHPYIPHELLVSWTLKRLNDPACQSVEDLGQHVAIGVIKDGKPICVVIYNGYREMKFGNELRAIIVAEDPRWCLPGVLRELFRYPFEIANCERLVAVVRDGNERSLKMCKGLGFRKEGVLRKGYDGKTNAILLCMLKSECKWLDRSRAKEKNNGREIAKGAEAAGSGKGRSGNRRSEQGSGAGVVAG
jgi:hypothetical protein